MGVAQCYLQNMQITSTYEVNKLSLLIPIKTSIVHSLKLKHNSKQTVVVITVW